VITFCRSEEGKTLLSDGEEPSYDEAEDITWVEEKRCRSYEFATFESWL